MTVGAGEALFKTADGFDPPEAMLDEDCDGIAHGTCRCAAWTCTCAIMILRQRLEATLCGNRPTRACAANAGRLGRGPWRPSLAPKQKAMVLSRDVERVRTQYRPIEPSS